MSHYWLKLWVHLRGFNNPKRAEVELYSRNNVLKAAKLILLLWLSDLLTRMQPILAPVYQTLAPLPVFFEVECVEDELGFPQGVVRLLLGGKAHTLGHLCRVAASSLALDPHLQVHRCFLLALGPIMHRLGHIKALPAGFVNGDQPRERETRRRKLAGE